LAGPATIDVWSRAVARRLAERSLLSDFGSRVYTLLIGMCVIRAVISIYFALTLSLSASIRGELAILQLGVSGAAFSALAGLQAARYACRIDGAILFAETQAFPLFRRHLARRFLAERPFAVAGGVFVAGIGAVACLIDANGGTFLGFLLAAASTLVLTFSIYRFAPGGAIRKHGFKVELAIAAVCVIANPDVLNDGRRVASTLFFSVIPHRLMGIRPLYVLLVYSLVALGLFVFFTVEASTERLSLFLRKKWVRRGPVWAMPLRHVGWGYWAAVWGLSYVLYAFSGRTATAMILTTTSLAVVGGIGRVISFLGTCAQLLSDDGSGNFPPRYWLFATILIAAPHFLPCAILAFVE
jgi:hypothetical protein